jgi:hypothetical protein
VIGLVVGGWCRKKAFGVASVLEGSPDNRINGERPEILLVAGLEILGRSPRIEGRALE